MANRYHDLSNEELVEELFKSPLTVPDSKIAQIQTEFTRRQIGAIQDFNRESGRQAKWMIRLTWVIVVLTVVLGAIAAVQLWAMLVKGA